MTSQCAACGREGKDLKTCNGCKMVKYCNASCQKRHRPEHRQKCQERAAQLFDEKLFADPPPREECPICFLPMRYGADECTYQACCGKIICYGCRVAAIKAAIDAGNSNCSDEKCAFCRATPSILPFNSISDQNDLFVRLKKRMSAGDAEAFMYFGSIYYEGSYGVPQNATKAFELWSKSADLGSVDAHENLGIAYNNGEGVGKDLVKAKHHCEIAAIGGNDFVRCNLGVIDANSGNFDRAKKHWMIAAMRGHDESLGNLEKMYAMGDLSKEDFEKALRAHKDSQDDMKSEQRDFAKTFRQIL